MIGVYKGLFFTRNTKNKHFHGPSWPQKSIKIYGKAKISFGLVQFFVCWFFNSFNLLASGFLELKSEWDKSNQKIVPLFLLFSTLSPAVKLQPYDGIFNSNSSTKGNQTEIQNFVNPSSLSWHCKHLPTVSEPPHWLYQ